MNLTELNDKMNAITLRIHKISAQPKETIAGLAFQLGAIREQARDLLDVTTAIHNIIYETNINTPIVKSDTDKEK